MADNLKLRKTDKFSEYIIYVKNNSWYGLWIGLSIIYIITYFLIICFVGVKKVMKNEFSEIILLMIILFLYVNNTLNVKINKKENGKE